jgi:hypothetical protein
VQARVELAREERSHGARSGGGAVRGVPERRRTRRHGLRGAHGEIGLVDLEDGLPEALTGLDIDENDLLSDGDLEVFSESLGDDQQGVALVFEEVWAKEAVNELESLGAEIALYARIPPDNVDAAFAAQEA